MMNHFDHTPTWGMWMTALGIILWLAVCLVFSFGFPSC